MCWWAGLQSDWCVSSLPLSQGQDSLWSGVAPVWATCTLPGLWCCCDGIWHIGGGSTRCTGAGGAGLAQFAIGGPLREGPCSTERGRQAHQRDGSTESTGICTVQASSVTGTGSLWDFGWGMGEGDGSGQRLCSPTELSSVFRGSTTLPPHVPLPSVLSESRAVDF